MSLKVPGPLLSVSQAARLLGVHANTIRAWTDSIRLSAFRINRRGDRRYRTTDVRALLVEDAAAPTLANPGVPGTSELAVFSRIAAELSQPTVPSAVATAAALGIRTHLGVERVAIYAADSDDATLALSAHHGMDDLPTMVPADDPDRWPAGAGITVLPLRAGAGMVGLLVMQVRDTTALSEHFKRALTESVASHLANARLLVRLASQTNELERRAESQRSLLEVNHRLLWTLDQGDVLETIADGLREVVAHDNLSIYRVDHAGRVMLPDLAREVHADEVNSYVISFGSGLMGWAVEHGEAILANDALADPRAVQMPGTSAEPEAVIVVPLIADGAVLGALNLSRTGGSDVAFSEGDFQLVQLFAAQAAIAMRNADAHHAMSQRAETDALTGLLNHGAFQRDLALLVEELEGRGPDQVVALLMMDLDRFKAYNDHHGHPAGDQLLSEAAAAIRGAVRGDDRVYRYGGDEFALIIPGASVVDAMRVAECVRDALASLSASDPTPVTITVGIAGLPGDAVDRGGLIAAADAALYYGKRSGADCVIRADAVPRHRPSDASHGGRDAA